jgi:hypothetical protein
VFSVAQWFEWLFFLVENAENAAAIQMHFSAFSAFSVVRMDFLSHEKKQPRATEKNSSVALGAFPVLSVIESGLSRATAVAGVYVSRQRSLR